VLTQLDETCLHNPCALHGSGWMLRITITTNILFATSVHNCRDALYRARLFEGAL
jgi:hypothetical protein